MKQRLSTFALFALSVPGVLPAITYWDWRAASFPEEQLYDETISGATADPDGDGMTNLHEYVFAGRPLNSDANLAPVLEPIFGTLALTYRERHDLTDVQVHLQGSDTLHTWITYNSVTAADRVARAGYDEVTLLAPGSLDESETGRRFLRLRLDLSASPSLRAPSQLSVSALTPSLWQVMWTDPNTTETGYAVERRDFAGNWTRLTTLQSDTGTWTQPGVSYLDGTTYRVVAIGADLSERHSEPVTLTDTDGDGIPDVFELGADYAGVAGTYATYADRFSSDGSGVSDGWAPLYGFVGTPTTADSDGDGIDDLTEAQNGLNPNSDDTDRDGRTDDWELANGCDPLERHSAYSLFRTGSAPLSLASNISVQFGSFFASYSPRDRWRTGTHLSLPLPTSLYGSADVKLYPKHLRDADNSVFLATYLSGLNGVTAADGRDQLLYESWSGETDQIHDIIVVWPADNLAVPYTIQGTPWFYDIYVSEGFNASWNSSAMLMRVDLIGRVWAKVNTAAITYKLRVYTGQNAFADVYAYPTDRDISLTVLQSDGVKAIGYINDSFAGLDGAFVGKPQTADLVNFCPLALNRRGDLLGEDTPYDGHLGYFYSREERRVLDAEHYGVEVLQQQLGAYVSAAFVRLADGTQTYLPIDVDVVTGFDDEANVYGREVGGRPVIWPADPSKWGLPTGTPAYTAVPYETPLLPKGFQSLVKVRPGANHSELVRVARENSGVPVGDEGYLIVPASLSVDYNRDGTIQTNTEGETDSTSAKRMFRFWSNDDNDGMPPDEDEHVSPGSPDYTDRTITSRRDLEDFARLWLNIGGLQDAIASGQILIGLKWKNTGGTSPSINIYKAVETDGGTKYLTDTATATAQVGPATTQCRSIPNKDGQSVSVTSGTTFIFGANFWTGFNQSSPPKYLLFEGCTPGKGQLVITLHKADGTEIGEGPGVWMDIKNIQSMYQRVKVTPRDPNGIPKPYRSSTTFDANTSGTEAFDNGYPLQAASDEAKTALVFVHGSNIPYEEARWNAETMFKRLYLQGYKGRFVLFCWDTLVGFDVPLPDPLNQVPALPYNLNEYRALKYGPALKNYVASLAQGGRTVNVASHSLGAGVVLSALHAGMSVNNYLIMQGAYSAKSFNVNLPTLQKFQDAENEHATPDLANKLGYGGYLSGVSGTVVNMLNQFDFALATGSISVPIYGGIELNWEANQLISKPDDPLGVGQYYYYPYSEGSVSYTLTGTTRLIYDAHESMAFVARTRTKAVGAMPGVGGIVSQDIDLSEGTIYDFKRIRADHSAQFTRRVQDVQAFYRTVFEKVR
jgi:hypothetical protein